MNLKSDPYSGVQLHRPVLYLWELKCGKFRLFYEIRPHSRIVILRRIVPRSLQAHTLRNFLRRTSLK